jgi:hypothetical protein
MTHRRDETTDAGRQSPRFLTVLAEDAETVRAAQRLRYRVFRAANAFEEPRERLSRESHQRLSHEAIEEIISIAIAGTWWCAKRRPGRSTATAAVLMVLPMAAMAPRFRARLLRGDPPSRGGGRRTRWAA